MEHYLEAAKKSKNRAFLLAGCPFHGLSQLGRPLFFCAVVASHLICPSVNALPFDGKSPLARSPSFFSLPLLPPSHSPIPRPPSGNRPWKEAFICEVNILPDVSGPVILGSQRSNSQLHSNAKESELRWGPSRMSYVDSCQASTTIHRHQFRVIPPHSEGSRPE